MNIACGKRAYTRAELVSGELQVSQSFSKIFEYVEANLGEVEFTYHEKTKEEKPIDIIVIGPAPARNFYTVLTSGMSDSPMSPPDGNSDCAYSELLICLPEDWGMSKFDWLEEKFFWPIALLRFLASYPEEYQAWLWKNHTIESVTRKPYAKNVEVKNCILLPSKMLSQKLENLEDENKTIFFHSVIPLHDSEVEFKIDKGVDALIKKMNKEAVNDLYNPHRQSVVPEYEGLVSHKMFRGID